MKKRFISLALCLLMLTVAVVTAACGEDSTEGTLTIDGTTDAPAMTLSIWGIKGEGTTDEAIAMVEAAMSKLSQAQYNTAIDLILLEEDEYEAKLEAYMDEIQARKDAEKEAEAARKKAEKEAKAKGETLATEAVTEATESAADETVLDEYNLPTTLYPEVGENQLDIFLITDFEMLIKFNDKGVITSIDNQLSGESKLIKSYVHPSLISAAKIGGKTLGVINQQIVGDYTYMLVNKELLEKYYWDIDDIATLSDAYLFIRDVERDEPEYQPIVGDLSPLSCNYFSPNGDKTIFGTMLASTAVYGDAFAPKMLFEFTYWRNYTKLYSNLKLNGCIGSETFTPEDKFGVGIIKGNADDIEPYTDEYHVVTLQAPQGTTENLFNGMFAVSTYTKDVDRSMEILTYLNTRAEFRNLFGYGIEGVHYKLDGEDRLTKISDDYNMKLEYTGNCFIAYAPNGETMEYWDMAKEHNQALVLSPYFRFEITEEDIDMEYYEYMLGLANDFYAALDLCDEEDEASLVIDEYWELYENDEMVLEWLNESPLPNGDKPAVNTLAKFYAEWSKIRK